MSVLERCLDSYGRLHRIEESARIYELLGFRTLYERVACLFGEKPLPSCRELVAPSADALAGLTRESVCAIRDRSHYYEIINLFTGLAYLPLILILGSLKTGLFTLCYALIFFGSHLLIVPVERYKRALCGLLLQQEALDRAVSPRFEPLPLPNRSPATDGRLASSTLPGEQTGRWSSGFRSLFASLLYGPWWFETEGLYRALGVDVFRQWMLALDRITAPPEQRRHKLRSMPGLGVENMEAYERKTCVAQSTHLVGALLHLPFVVFLVSQRSLFGIAYLLLLLAVDIYALLLQRATRIRLRRVLERRRASRK